MSIKLRHKPVRLDALGNTLPRPYILDRWCNYCGCGLVDREFHPVEACVVHVATRDYEKTNAAVKRVLDGEW